MWPFKIENTQSVSAANESMRSSMQSMKSSDDTNPPCVLINYSIGHNRLRSHMQCRAAGEIPFIYQLWRGIKSFTSGRPRSRRRRQCHSWHLRSFSSMETKNGVLNLTSISHACLSFHSPFAFDVDLFRFLPKPNLQAFVHEPHWMEDCECARGKPFA